MSTLSKISSKMFGIFNNKTDDQGNTYISFAYRYVSIIGDTICLFTMLQLVAQLAFMAMGEYAATLETIEKYRLKIDMDLNEISQMKTHMAVHGIVQLAEFATMYLFYMFFWTQFGGTPAKLIMGMRLVDKNSLRFLSKKQATKRFFAYFISIITLGIGVIWAAWDKKTQMFHDKIANSVVLTRESLSTKHADDPFDSFTTALQNLIKITLRFIANKITMLLSHIGLK